MGYLIKAVCDCGYSQKTSLGGSRMSRGVNTPHHCQNCEQVVTVDLMDDEYVCPECGSLDVVSYAAETKCAQARHEQLTEKELEQLGLHPRSAEAACSSSVSLLKSGNYCPRCHGEKLRFIATGSFS